MDDPKRASISSILPVTTALIVAFGSVARAEAGKGTNTLCEQPYALCTSAPCVPQPGDPTKAICWCDVEEGKSMSTVPCDTIRPSTDADGIRTVYSTFSLAQAQEGKRGMKCPNGAPWTWCLNKICTVDPIKPEKAICVCDVVRGTGDWMTFGGDCDASTCRTGYWSGALLADFESGNAFMGKALGLAKSPAQWCPR